MDKIREALEGVLDCDRQGTGRPNRNVIDMVEEALALLSAPVASDARELAADIVDDVTIEIQGAIGRTTAKIERFVAERERKAREEELRKAVSIVEKMECECGFESDSDHSYECPPCQRCKALEELDAAIKEAGNGKS